MNSKKKTSPSDNNDMSSKRAKIEEQDTGDNNTDFTKSFKGIGIIKGVGAGDTAEQPGPSKGITPEMGKFIDQSDSEDETLPKKEGGTLLFTGGTNWDLLGRKSLPKNTKGSSVMEKLWEPHRLSALNDIKVLFVASSSSACHSVLITDDGRVMTWGRNEKHQLGLGDNICKNSPTPINNLSNGTITSAACGRSHTLFLDRNGSVYSCGDNNMGQCGIGSQNGCVIIPTKVAYHGDPIAKVVCGADFSVLLDKRGALHSFGFPEYGQLGHNSDGRYAAGSRMIFKCETKPKRIAKYIEKTKSGQITVLQNVLIIDVACGPNHCVALDIKKRCFSWGFAGYGRLGHAETKDEMMPRLITTFHGYGLNENMEKVYAGGCYSMAINVNSELFYWGSRKPKEEATMYPKPVQDLVSWKVREVACAKTSVVAIADDSVVSWGPSPTFGELGLGAYIKSSPVPQVCKALNDLVIKQVACGVGHTLFIVRDSTESDKNKLKRIPVFSP